MARKKNNQSNDESSQYDENTSFNSFYGKKHTAEHPYCDNDACECHSDDWYDGTVTDFNPYAPVSDKQLERAHRFFGIFGK
jgi:hypothetical protein